MVHANGSARQDAEVGRPPPGDAPYGPSQRRLFRGEERELQRVRSWLAGLLPDCPARDDLISVAVELGTNAIQHTLSGRGGWFTVEVAWHGPVVRVAVADDGAATGPHMNGDAMSDGGRGLVIVHALSTRTGVSGNHFGRTVWAEIPWGTDPVPASAAPDRRPVPAANPRSGR